MVYTGVVQCSNDEWVVVCFDCVQDPTGKVGDEVLARIAIHVRVDAVHGSVRLPGLQQGLCAVVTVAHSARLTILPAKEPVGSPRSNASTPFTQTFLMPVDTAVGSFIVAWSIAVSGSKRTRSA